MCAAGGFAFLAYARNEKLLENGIRFALPLWNGQNGMLIALGAKTIQHTAINLLRRSKDEHVRNALQAGKGMWRISSVEDFRRSGCTVGGCERLYQLEPCGFSLIESSSARSKQSRRDVETHLDTQTAQRKGEIRDSLWTPYG